MISFDQTKYDIFANDRSYYTNLEVEYAENIDLLDKCKITINESTLYGVFLIRQLLKEYYEREMVDIDKKIYTDYKLRDTTEIIGSIPDLLMLFTKDFALPLINWFINGGFQELILSYLGKTFLEYEPIKDIFQAIADYFTGHETYLIGKKKLRIPKNKKFTKKDIINLLKEQNSDHN